MVGKIIQEFIFRFKDVREDQGIIIVNMLVIVFFSFNLEAGKQKRQMLFGTYRKEMLLLTHWFGLSWSSF